MTETFQEPTGGAPAGTMTVQRVRSPYERFMAKEGLPLYVRNGFRDIRELALKHWPRYGANGAFLVCGTTMDQLGLVVIEVPPRGVTEPVQHVYESVFWVVEGRGTTEVTAEPGARPQRFEWGAGAFFAIPMNASYRFVNATNERVLILGGSNAPSVIDTFVDEEFVFANTHRFRDRYAGEADYFAPPSQTLITPDLGRAMWETSLIPDIVGTELPLDNQRSPGYRRIEPRMARGRFRCFIGEHPVGRYSKAHHHQSGAVLICVQGQGYTYNWPTEAGPTPWRDGRVDAVERVDYVAGGMVAAAPGGGDWYHQHFGVGDKPLRLMVWSGAAGSSRTTQVSMAVDEGADGTPKKKHVWLNEDAEKGGRSIGYRAEDPHIREEFRRLLAEEGGEFAMPADAYS